jgi:hypothetical protein
MSYKYSCVRCDFKTTNRKSMVQHVLTRHKKKKKTTPYKLVVKKTIYSKSKKTGK